MTHQVLARKWRPRQFNEVIGQAHVVKALTNAFNQQYLHHAYLFSGTRGVGKTTLARIIAKCLNCEKGISADPCGKCSHCQEIDAGRFPDLYEVDAASRTKVEDTRELLDNVQYAPTKGRFKIYLIDEVHMLSGHSFNALLKTLEEPPSHVKFLLATTDPQNLPATVLSRCLQFHLTLLTPEQISEHLQTILKQEKIEFDNEATLLIGKAAHGSLRDALSLLDQSIAYGNGKIVVDDVKNMLGTIEASALIDILNALHQKNANAIIENTNKLANQGIDFSQALSEILSLLHQLAVIQMIPDVETTPELKALAKNIQREDVQLYYQIGLIGQRDLPFAPTPKAGFEMTLLRMMAFTPNIESNEPKRPSTSMSRTTSSTQLNEVSAHTWPEILSQLSLSGFALALAQQCSLVNVKNNTFHFHLHEKYKSLMQKKYQHQIEQALNQHFKESMKVTVDIVSDDINTPASLAKKEIADQQQQAEHAIFNDEKVQQILQTFDGKVIKESITPNKYN